MGLLHLISLRLDWSKLRPVEKTVNKPPSKGPKKKAKTFSFLEHQKPRTYQASLHAFFGEDP
jgi:hypothetical protein